MTTEHQPTQRGGELVEPVGYLFDLRYSDDHWSAQKMFSYGLPQEGDYRNVTALYPASSISTLEAERDEARKERDEARAFVLEFRGVVTDEMVERACAAYFPEDWRDGTSGNRSVNRPLMRKALEAANICESCASVADHWSKRAESAEATVERLREGLATAADGLNRIAQHHNTTGLHGAPEALLESAAGIAVLYRDEARALLQEPSNG